MTTSDLVSCSNFNLLQKMPDIRQGCKMDCENCEIANCDCEKNTISQITQFSFLTIGRNRNITQFDFLEGRNCESCENYFIEGFFFEK